MTVQKHTNRKPKKSQQQKGENRSTRRARLGQEEVSFDENAKHYVAPSIEPKNTFQKQLLKALNTKQIVCVKAPAGSGKTFVVMSHCADKLKRKEINKIIISRPNVHMGKSLGAVPGDVDMKLTPLIIPLIEVIKDRYGKGFYESNLNNHNIELLAMEYARGRNFNDVTVVDESQGLLPDEMYTLLTRVAEGGQLILMGDVSQKDIRAKDGLTWLDEFVSNHPELSDSVAVVEGNSDDIVRSTLCQLVVKAKESDIAVGIS